MMHVARSFKRLAGVGVVVAATAVASVLAAQPTQTPAGPDTAAIDRVFGISGQLQGDVYRVSWPRTDQTVSVDGVAIKPGFALGSWAAFRRAGTSAVIHGDLVLLEPEVNPVISKLQAAGLDITALHNHLARETPHLMYLHYWGMGAEAALAQGLRDALATTKTPLSPAPAAGAPQPDPGFDVNALQTALGRTGTVRGGVLSISIPRPETITMMGVTLPPAMGMATAFNFQSDGAGQVVGTGDFVMTDDEVNPIAKALRAHDINVTALHNHMLHGTPTLYFMHFWARGTAPQVGAGLKAATDLLKK